MKLEVTLHVMLVSLQKATRWVHFFGSMLSLPTHNIALWSHFMSQNDDRSWSPTTKWLYIQGQTLRNSLKACLHSHGTTCRLKACILVWRFVTLAELEELGPHPVLAVDAGKATGVCYSVCCKWPTGNLLLERERWIRRHHACQLCWHIIGGSCHNYNFCCDKDTFVMTKDVFCHDKHILSRQKMCFVTTNIFLLQQNFCCDKLIFVATNTCLSWQNTSFVVTKVRLSWQTHVCCDKSLLQQK